MSSCPDVILHTKECVWPVWLPFDDFDHLKNQCEVSFKVLSNASSSITVCHMALGYCYSSVKVMEDRVQLQLLVHV